MQAWIRAYRVPMLLLAVFVALMVVLAAVPDTETTDAEVVARSTAEPTPGPRERQCPVCGIDETCDPDSGQCRLVEWTPPPCVESARFDERAGFCLPVGAPPAPAPVVDSGEEVGDPEKTERPDAVERRRERSARQPRQPSSGGSVGE